MRKNAFIVAMVVLTAFVTSCNFNKTDSSHVSKSVESKTGNNTIVGDSLNTAIDTIATKIDSIKQD